MAKPVHDPVVIAAAKRTPIGGFMGALKPLSATRLGSIAISALAPHDVDEVIMGNVLSAGLGQAPARQAALGAAVPDSVPCRHLEGLRFRPQGRDRRA